MNTIFCLAVICAFAALAQAETCHDIGDCTHVTCPEANYVLECHNRECTCTQQANSGCSMASECNGADCRHTWHCVDGRCRCGFGFPTGGK